MRPPRAVPLVGLAIFVGCESATDVAPDMAPRMEASIVSDSDGTRPYIVAAQGELPANLADVVGAHGGVLRSTLPQIGVAVVDSDDAGFMDAMAPQQGIAFVVPDILLELPDGTAGFDLQSHLPIPIPIPAAGGTDLGDLQWGLEEVGGPAAWAAGQTGAGVRVAVLDAGIDHDHPDLAPNLNSSLSISFTPCIFGLNCDSNGNEDWRVSPGFYYSHGTHTAGIIAAAADGNGVTGVAPDAELVAVKVCTEFISFCPISSMLAGLVYAADIDADLVNMSIGVLGAVGNEWWMPYCTQVLGLPRAECGKWAHSCFLTAQNECLAQAFLMFQRAFQYAYSKGTTVIVAAGNGALNLDRSKDTWAAFADLPHVVGVSALGPVGWCLDPSGTDVNQLAYYSNYGQSIVDVSAPGGNFYGQFLSGSTQDPCTVDGVTRVAWAFDGVMSTMSGGWGWWEGTSFAAPHAVGVAAIITGANGGDISPSLVEQKLEALAEDLGDRGRDAIYGSGRVSTGY